MSLIMTKSFAVILESTGDISVLHSANADKNERFDKNYFQGLEQSHKL